MLGSDKVANAYGIVAFVNGISSAIGPPLLSKRTCMIYIFISFLILFAYLS